jgi:hypothetical protein
MMACIEVGMVVGSIHHHSGAWIWVSSGLIDVVWKLFRAVSDGYTTGEMCKVP